MNKINFLIVVVAFTLSNAKAQIPSFQWAKQFGSTAFDRSNSVALDASGNVYTTGFFIGTVDFNPGAGVYNLTAPGGVEDIFISKLDPLGNFVWAKQIGNIGSDVGNWITVDGSGNVYTVGTFSGNVDFDPGPGAFLMSSSIIDIFISKLDAAGNFLWAKRIGGPTSNENVFCVSTDALGNVYTTGVFQTTIDFDPSGPVFNLTSAGSNDIFVLKLDAAGNFVWAKQLGGAGADNGYSIALDITGNVYTTGTFSSTADFDPGVSTYTLASTGNSDIFVSKLDVSGNFVWAKQMGGTSLDRGNSITLDASGNVYTTGWFNVSGDFDPGAGVYTLNSLGSTDGFVSKLDASGNFIWAKQMGGSGGVANGFSMALDATGNIYTTGIFFGTTDFDPGAGTFTLTPAGSYDVFVSKLDGSGSFTWAGKMGGTSADYVFSIGLDGSNNVFTTGTFSATADFDPGTGTYNLASMGNNDIFISKLNNCTVPSQPSSISGLTSLCAGSGAQNYSITPVSGATTYSWSLSVGWIGTSTTNVISAAPGSSGIFSVSVTNTCGTSSAQTLSVTVNALPTISATTSNTLICVGQSATLTASGASSYTFNPGGAGTSIVVSPTVTSTYTINGTDINGCTNSSSFTQSVSTCAGINQISNSVSEIQVYPNPFNNKITIVSNSTKQPVLIYNAIGTLINKTEIENEKIEIDFSKESSGIYFIRIGTEIKKIIKE